MKKLLCILFPFGSIGRLEFLIHTIGTFICISVIGFALMQYLELRQAMSDDEVVTAGIVCFYLSYLFLFVRELTAIIKRFKNIGMSGWNVFALMIPIYNFYLYILLYFQAAPKSKPKRKSELKKPVKLKKAPKLEKKSKQTSPPNV
jgi:uncharacterized membrane protein YhaH (DUF805 family)